MTAEGANLPDFDVSLMKLGNNRSTCSSYAGQ
jgi:hypothetical protein